MTGIVAPCLNIPARSEEWLAARSRNIGASDAAGCVPGASPYNTPTAIYERKVTGEKVWANNNMLAGIRLQEDIEVAAKDILGNEYSHFALKDGSEELWASPNNERLTCTPDLLLSAGALDIVVECKVSTNFGRRWEQKVEKEGVITTERTPPKDVLYQLQHQLAVLGGIYQNPDYDWGAVSLVGYIAVLPLGVIPRDLTDAQSRIYLFGPISPSREIIAELETHTLAMVECLENRTRPGTDKHYAHYNGQVGAPEKYADVGAVKNVEADYELAAQIRTLPSQEASVKPHTDKIKSIKDAAKRAIVDAGGSHLIDSDGTVLATYKPQQVLDWGGFAARCGVDEGADIHETLLAYPQHIDDHITLSDKARRLAIVKNVS